MAAALKNTTHGGSVVYGTMAYDYGRTDTYREKIDRPVDRQVIIPAAPKIREQTVAATGATTRQTIAPTAIIGFICAAILVIFTLMAKIQLTEVTDISAHLEQQLNDLQVSQNRLLINYEKAFNLTDIEEYATTRLGMQRPREEQVFYLSSSVPDKAVILSGEGDDGSFKDRVINALSSLGQYFR